MRVESPKVVVVERCRELGRLSFPGVMGRLRKNHWARLIILAAGTYQVAAALEGFFWPKIFWDFLTRALDPAVKQIPVLQSINLIFGLILLIWEWPLSFIAGSRLHRSIEARLVFLPLTAFTAALIYQGTNVVLYQLIGLALYFWAYIEGEIIHATPWTLP